MRLIQLAVLFVPLLLAACSNSTQQVNYYPDVQHSGIDSITYSRMVHNHDLDLSDIAALARANISDETTLGYLRQQKTVYHLTPEDVGTLRQAGVSREIVDFMLQTPRYYTSYKVAAGSGFYVPYYDDYWGPPYPDYPSSKPR